MLNKQMAIQTLRMLEDHLDVVSTLKLEDEYDVGAIQSTINFWRTLIVFLPEEERTC